MTQLAALQNLALFTLTLLSFSPLLRLCAAQNNLFPPLPPLGLFGGLLDGLGLGPSSPAATNSPPASPTYTQPPTSPATRQSSSRGSDASGTIIPVVTTPPASSTPTAPATSTLVPASPAATAAPSTPSSPAAAADDEDNPAAQRGPAAGQSGIAIRIQTVANELCDRSTHVHVGFPERSIAPMGDKVTGRGGILTCYRT